MLSDFLNGPEGSKMSELGDLSCWVCGKEKARKCAACLASGFEIFFCSPEHQRLVRCSFPQFPGIDVYAFSLSAGVASAPSRLRKSFAAVLPP